MNHAHTPAAPAKRPPHCQQEPCRRRTTSHRRTRAHAALSASVSLARRDSLYTTNGEPNADHSSQWPLTPAQPLPPADPDHQEADRSVRIADSKIISLWSMDPVIGLECRCGGVPESPGDSTITAAMTSTGCGTEGWSLVKQQRVVNLRRATGSGFPWGKDDIGPRPSRVEFVLNRCRSRACVVSSPRCGVVTTSASSAA